MAHSRGVPVLSRTGHIATESHPRETCEEWKTPNVGEAIFIWRRNTFLRIHLSVVNGVAHRNEYILLGPDHSDRGIVFYYRLESGVVLCEEVIPYRYLF